MKRRQLLKAPLLGVGATALGSLGLTATNAASAQSTGANTLNSADTPWVEVEGWMVSPDAKRARLERQLAQRETELNQVQSELNQVQDELSSAKRTIETLEAESERSWTDRLRDLF